MSVIGYDRDPLDPIVENGRLHGRGSYDRKAGLAAMMVAAARTHRGRHSGAIVLALVRSGSSAAPDRVSAVQGP